jgi:hypothetical protein
MFPPLGRFVPQRLPHQIQQMGRAQVVCSRHRLSRRAAMDLIWGSRNHLISHFHRPLRRAAMDLIWGSRNHLISRLHHLLHKAAMDLIWE